MIFTETNLKGAFVIDIEKIPDNRGFFTTLFSQQAYGEAGLEVNFKQTSLSYNVKKGTLRGMHYQIAPFEEVKLVRCVSGAIYDVIVDLRPSSPTYKQYFGVELTSENYRALYVPRNFAHGFITLADETKVLYQLSAQYSPEHARGVRWDDPSIAIKWPLMPVVVSARDQNLPVLTTA